MSINFGLKQFRVASPARSEVFLSYVIWDRKSGEALFLDPHFSAVQEYSDFVSDRRLKPVLIVESALHFSHPSAAHALSKQFGIPVAMSDRTESDFVDRRLSDGEVISFGGMQFSTLLTPGIRSDALCLHGPGVVMTGETLWAGESSAFGFPGADLEAYWKSLNRLKASVSPEDLLFSGYDVRDLSFSIWQTELEKNPDLCASGLSELQRLKAKFPVRLSEDLSGFAKFNSSKSSIEPRFHKSESPFHLDQLDKEPHAFSNISAEKLSHKFGDMRKAVLIDVREDTEFKAGRIPGSLNCPLSELPFRLEELRRAPRVYVSCQSGRRSTFAAATLSYIGFNDVVMLTGGFQAWQNAGLPVEK